MATSSEAAAGLKTYRGNCHCGAFIYEVKLPELNTVYQCNCSICTKKGYLWAFPDQANFSVVKGDEKDLTSYEFAGHRLSHLFCPTCGSGVLGKRKEASQGQLAVNVHCIQNLNTWELEKSPFDGASIPPAFEPAKYTGPEPVAAVEDAKLYTGSCHCGAVTLALKSKPLDKTYKERIVECNCSICERNSYIWAYPNHDQVVIQGQDNLSYYRFGTMGSAKAFCKKCGVQLVNLSADLTPEEAENISADGKKRSEMLKKFRPVNLRVLDGFDLQGLSTEHVTVAAKMDPPYVNP